MSKKTETNPKEDGRERKKWTDTFEIGYHCVTVGAIWRKWNVWNNFKYKLNENGSCGQRKIESECEQMRMSKKNEHGRCESKVEMLPQAQRVPPTVELWPMYTRPGHTVKTIWNCANRYVLRQSVYTIRLKSVKQWTTEISYHSQYEFSFSFLFSYYICMLSLGLWVASIVLADLHTHARPFIDNVLETEIHSHLKTYEKRMKREWQIQTPFICKTVSSLQSLMPACDFSISKRVSVDDWASRSLRRSGSNRRCSPIDCSDFKQNGAWKWREREKKAKLKEIIRINANGILSHNAMAFERIGKAGQAGWGQFFTYHF